MKITVLITSLLNSAFIHLIVIQTTFANTQLKPEQQLCAGINKNSFNLIAIALHSGADPSIHCTPSELDENSLIEFKHAGLDFSNDTDVPALSLALAKGNFKGVDLLLHRGANPNHSTFINIKNAYVKFSFVDLVAINMLSHLQNKSDFSHLKKYIKLLKKIQNQMPENPLFKAPFIYSDYKKYGNKGYLSRFVWDHEKLSSAHLLMGALIFNRADVIRELMKSQMDLEISDFNHSKEKDPERVKLYHAIADFLEQNI